MAITRSVWIDDDGSGTTGTVLNNAELQKIYNNIDAYGNGVPDVITAPLTGAVNNYDPGVRNRNVTVLLTGATAVTISGIVAGVQGQIITFKNRGDGIASFAHFSALSATGNKFVNIAGSAPTPIALDGVIQYIYVGTSWYAIAHEQGAWITPPFSAANFSASAGAWTLEASDVATLQYRVSGKTISIAFILNATSVSGGPVSLLILAAAMGGFGLAAGVGPASIADNGVWSAGYCDHGSGALRILKNGQAPFAASTNNTYVFGSITSAIT